MKPSTFLPPLATLGLGIAIGWFAKPDSQPGPAIAASPRSAERPAEKTPAPGSSAAKPDRSRPAKIERVKPEAEDEDDAETAARTARADERVTEMFTANYRKKLDAYIAALEENLNLTPGQKESLKTAIEGQLEQLKKFISDSEANFAAGGNPMEKLPPLGTEALDSQLAALLDPEQKTAFDAYKTREKARQVDAKALKRLAHLQGVLEFKEGQRDEIYRILSESAEASLAKPDPMSAYSDIFSGGGMGMNIDMDPYDLGIQQLFMESAADLARLQEDDKAMAKVFREKIDGLIENKVNELKPVLDEAQLEKYRQELKTKGLGPYGTMLEQMGE